jgi:hypothetical protein
LSVVELAVNGSVDESPSGPESWLSVFAVPPAEGSGRAGARFCADKPVPQYPDRDQALLELFDVPCRRGCAERRADKFDVDHETVDALSDWLGERLAGNLGQAVPGIRKIS